MKNRQRGLCLLVCIHFYSVIDILADDSAKTILEHVHVANCAFGCLASAAYIVRRGDAFEVNIPATKLALSDYELRRNCRLWNNYINDLLSSL